jgi:hypothetical protein
MVSTASDTDVTSQFTAYSRTSAARARRSSADFPAGRGPLPARPGRQTCNLTYCPTVTFVTIAAASLSAQRPLPAVVVQSVRGLRTTCSRGRIPCSLDLLPNGTSNRAMRRPTLARRTWNLGGPASCAQGLRPPIRHLFRDRSLRLRAVAALHHWCAPTSLVLVDCRCGRASTGSGMAGCFVRPPCGERRRYSGGGIGCGSQGRLDRRLGVNGCSCRSIRANVIRTGSAGERFPGPVRCGR